MKEFCCHALYPYERLESIEDIKEQDWNLMFWFCKNLRCLMKLPPAKYILFNILISWAKIPDLYKEVFELFDIY